MSPCMHLLHNIGEAFVFQGRQQLPQVHHLREGRRLPREILLETVWRPLRHEILESVPSQVHNEKAKRMRKCQDRNLDGFWYFWAMAVQVYEINFKVYPPRSGFSQIESLSELNMVILIGNCFASDREYLKEHEYDRHTNLTIMMHMDKYYFAK